MSISNDYRNTEMPSCNLTEKQKFIHTLGKIGKLANTFSLFNKYIFILIFPDHKRDFL